MHETIVDRVCHSPQWLCARRDEFRTHHKDGSLAILLMVGFLLPGCGGKSSDLNTAPQGDVAVDTVNTSSELPSAESVVSSTTLGGPLRGLDATELARFSEGLTEFETAEAVDEGLGPVFNEAACVTCHAAPTGGTTGRTETRFGSTNAGRFDPLANLGGSLLQDHGIGLVTTAAGSHTFDPEVVPRSATVTAQRVTTPLFGLGLVDAVPDALFLALARLEARYAPSTAGTANMVTEIRTGAQRVGRFGWKAQVPTLHQFAGDAYLNEMGVTSPEFPNENAPQGDAAALAFNPLPTLNDAGDGVDKFADFMTLLGAPPRGAAIRPDGTGCVRVPADRMRQLSRAHLGHGSEPGGCARAQGVPALLGLPASRHGDARGRDHAGSGDGPRHAHGAVVGPEQPSIVPARWQGRHTRGRDPRA